MTWTPDDIPDQHGRVAVITGANGGLGLETARELARRGACVVMAARDQAKAAEAREAIERVGRAEVEVVALDLASLESVHAGAEAILRAHGSIDLLVNNAGVMATPEQTTTDGFELQLGVNHLGHFVLTRRLLPALLRSPSARVVTVTSFARLTGRPVDPANPHLRGAYDPWRAYGQSKLSNLQFAMELQRRLAGAGAPAQSLAAHPGLSETDLQARSVRETSGGASQRFWHVLARYAGMAPAEGVRPLLRAATDPHARGGEMYGPRWGSFGPPVRRPLLRRLGPDGLRILWELSERETGEDFDVARLVAGGPRAGR